MSTYGYDVAAYLSGDCRASTPRPPQGERDSRLWPVRPAFPTSCYIQAFITRTVLHALSPASCRGLRGSNASTLSTGSHSVSEAVQDIPVLSNGSVRRNRVRVKWTGQRERRTSAMNRNVSNGRIHQWLKAERIRDKDLFSAQRTRPLSSY